MKHEPEAEARWLAELTSLERARFLAWLTHSLTITGRAISLPSADAPLRLEQMRQLNEIQHRVASYIGHALGEDENPDWISVIAKYIFEPPDLELRRETSNAWLYTRREFQLLSNNSLKSDAAKPRTLG